jgi:hypothetical protein
MRAWLFLRRFLLLLGFPVLVLPNLLVAMPMSFVIFIDFIDMAAMLSGKRDDVRIDGCTGITSDLAPVRPDGRNRR